MYSSKLPQLVVCMVITVVLVAGVVIPLVSDAQTGSETRIETVTITYTNEGTPFALTSSDGTVHNLTVTLDNGSYRVITDGVESGEIEMYAPVTTGTANAIGIGVYEAYNKDGVLTSQANVTPTVKQTIDTFRTQALAGNTDVSMGTYQLWNFYQYTLYKMMGLTVMGNTDSQYMMGAGYTGASASAGPMVTGTTSSAYQRSNSAMTSASLFLENTWGSAGDFVGDVYFANRTMYAGDALGGNEITAVKSVNNEITLPNTESNYMISTISMNSDTWGVPTSVGPSGPAGQGINDRAYSDTGSRLLYTGGLWMSTSQAGLMLFRANNSLDSSFNNVGGRLAYVMTGADVQPADYGYVLSFDNSSGQTVITDVQALVDGTLVSKMPNGTELNSFWNFDSNGVGPFGCYYAAVNLASGSNADDSSEARLSAEKGEIAYRLNPNNLYQTLNGTYFDTSLYNVMLIVPTAYWYSDPVENRLYIGSSADKFSGIEMYPYAHTYTIDPDVHTGNPVEEILHASVSIVVGENAIVDLFENGTVELITPEGTIVLGSAESGDISFTITDDVLAYSGGTVSGIKAYISSGGNVVMCHNPYVIKDTQMIFGAYSDELETSSGEDVKVGYALTSTYENLESATVNVLDPVSSLTVTGTEFHAYSTDLENGAYRMHDLLFTTTWSDSSVSEEMYTALVVPAEVTTSYEQEVTVPTTGGVLGSLLTLLPLLLIVGLVILAIGILKFR